VTPSDVLYSHGGEATVNYVAEAYLHSFNVLESALANANGNALSPAIVSDLLVRTLQTLMKRFSMIP